MTLLLTLLLLNIIFSLYILYTVCLKKDPRHCRL